MLWCYFIYHCKNDGLQGLDVNIDKLEETILLKIFHLTRLPLQMNGFIFVNEMQKEDVYTFRQDIRSLL